MSDTLTVADWTIDKRRIRLTVSIKSGRSNAFLELAKVRIDEDGEPLARHFIDFPVTYLPEFVAVLAKAAVAAEERGLIMPIMPGDAA